MTPDEAARLALGCLDLTSLNYADTPSDVAALADRTHAWGLRPAAVCVWPRFVAQAKARVAPGVRVAAVANFPDGSLDLERVTGEIRACLAAGADEIDLVLPWRALTQGDLAGPTALVRAARTLSWGRGLKLILESGELQSRTAMAAACRLGLDAGVDFLKTSTGRRRSGATLTAAKFMLDAIAAHPRGDRVGFKASGGIRTVEQAAAYAELVRSTLGEAALNPQRLRFGASALWTDIQRVRAGEAGLPGRAGAVPAFSASASETANY